MGRIKTIFIKHFAQDLMESHGDKFTTSFDQNKKIVDQFVFIKYKRMRNNVTGYITAMKGRESRI